MGEKKSGISKLKREKKNLSPGQYYWWNGWKIIVVSRQILSARLTMTEQLYVYYNIF